MNEAPKKVIILNKLASPYISEAIIILKDGTMIPQSKVVEEAERIVLSYMQRQNGQPPKRAARSHTWKITAALCTIASVISCIICFILFR